MQDRETIAFIQSRGAQAKWVTSVCTGSMLLAAAGLLRGYQATSHWATRDLLPLGGATAVNQRVVVDRNRITGAGVTAGVDMGLIIVEKLRDRLYAQCTQLVAEYAPQPHLNAGTPETAPQLANDMMRSMFTQITADMARTLRSPQQKGNS
jgi:cyclohexyl-isocyanide hydratase